MVSSSRTYACTETMSYDDVIGDSDTSTAKSLDIYTVELVSALRRQRTVEPEYVPSIDFFEEPEEEEECVPPPLYGHRLPKLQLWKSPVYKCPMKRPHRVFFSVVLGRQGDFSRN